MHDVNKQTKIHFTRVMKWLYIEMIKMKMLNHWIEPDLIGLAKKQNNVHTKMSSHKDLGAKVELAIDK